METTVLLDIGPFKLSQRDREAMREACATAGVVETDDSLATKTLDCASS